MAVLLASALWIDKTWGHSPWLAVGGLAMLVASYAGVLGLEACCAFVINRTDRTQHAEAAAWAAAWWQEIKVAPRVFAWRQPFRWNLFPDSQCAPAKTGPAVVCVHGFFCNRGFWLPWIERLEKMDVPHVTVNLEPVFGSIDEYVPLLDAAVLRATALTGQPPILVCHSMGGLAARAWLAESSDAASRVRTIITIGTPHHGTWLARFSHLTNGREMRINSEWQATLTAREQARHPMRNAHLFVCWYSNTDNIVFPASSAMLPGADNRLVAGAAHVALAFHPTVMNESLAIVASAARSPCERAAS